MPDTTTRALYLSELQRHPLHFEAGPTEGTFVVKGLPVVREGNFNGFPFTSAHLDAILANFKEGHDAYGFEPPLRPFHAKDGEPVDVRKDTLGYMIDLYRKGDGLFCDSVVYDEETIANLQNGRYRYTSGEFAHTQAGPGTRLRANAFVDNPAVKTMPWQIVANSEEFPGGREAETDVDADTSADALDTAPPPVPDPSLQGGEQPMSMTLSEKVKALFKGKPAATEAEVLAVLQDEDPAVVALREEAETERTARLVAEAETVALREAEAQRVTVERQSAVAGHVAALLSERYIVPAQQEHLTTFLSALAGQEVTVTLADGATEQRDLAADAVALLREGAQIAETYFSKTSTEAPTEAQLSEKVERMAHAAGVAE